MTITLLLILLAAIVGAISAASRTFTKLKLQPTSHEFDSVQEAKSQEADQTRLQPDLDSERLEPAEVSPVQSSEVSTIAVPPMMPIAEPEIPLATSLKISDVVESDLSIEPKAEEHQVYSVLDEVEQLEHTGEKLSQLEHQATNSDHLMRLAVAVELGELAKQGYEIDRVVALLNQLTQDADLEVRVQAGASLSMIPVETTTD